MGDREAIGWGIQALDTRGSLTSYSIFLILLGAWIYQSPTNPLKLEEGAAVPNRAGILEFFVGERSG
jgi:hypothetical protein